MKSISKKKLFDSDYVVQKQTNKDLKKHIYHNILKILKTSNMVNPLLN